MGHAVENQEAVVPEREKLAWSVDRIREGMLLYAVTDATWLRGRKLADCVRQALEGGASFVQLRDKKASTQELVRQAGELISLCAAARVPFVVNDDVEAALLSGADGVHVGQGDAACEEARRILGPEAIVGVSVQTLRQALDAQAAGASYVGVGAMFSTDTKADAKVVAMDELALICSALDIPVVAIGGLNEGTISELSGSGVDGIAVVSAVFAAEDITASTRNLLDLAEAVIRA